MRGSKVSAIDIVESAYCLSGNYETWLTELSAHMNRAFDRDLGTVGHIVDVQAGETRVRMLVRVGNAPPEEAVLEELERNPNPAFLADRFLETGLHSLSETLAQVPDLTSHHEQMIGKPYGVHEVLVLMASDGLGTAVSVGVGQPRPRRTTTAERRLWSRVAVHVAAGLRLREQLAPELQSSAAGSGTTPDLSGVAEAILHPDGRLAHAEGPAQSMSAQERLRTAVKAADRARGRLRRTDPEAALDLWKGMVQGRWSLADRFESDGRRFVVACRNPLDVPNPRTLSERERQVLHLAALGRSNAEAGYALGLAETTVATHLAKALRKLRIATRTELCNHWAELNSDEARRTTVLRGTPQVDSISVPKRKPEWLSQLSPSEREIALDILRGRSNAQIAARRGTSLKTVVNQVGAIFDKLGVRGRADLAALGSEREVRGSKAR